MTVEAIDLVRRFARGGHTVRALDGVSVAVPDGQLTLIRGPSASGKTTLLNILAGLDRPSSGRALLDSRNLAEVDERALDGIRRQHMGFVFQGVALIASMSALENVEFGLRVAGHPYTARLERAEECLAAIGMSERLHHRPGELSGGEQQRVAIARGFAHRPALLFVDEPTAELDTETGETILAVLRQLVEAAATTIVMSSHDPQAVEYADFVVGLADGRRSD
jgi:putative ABC transport system ATP-binding protein